MNPINNSFKFLTSKIFSEFATRAKIARNSSAALSLTSIFIYIFIFGVKPLVAWLLFKFLDGAKPEMSWSIAVAAAVVLLFAHLFANPASRDTAGIIFLRTIHLAYDIPSRLALGIVKRRAPFVALGVLLIFGGLALIPIAHQHYQAAKEAQSRYDSVLSELKRFVERRRVSEYNSSFFTPIAKNFCALSFSPIFSSVQQDPAARDFMVNLVSLFDAKVPCLIAESATEPQPDFLHRAADSASSLEYFHCSRSSRLCGHVHTWHAKLHLTLAQEGRILDRTRRAHELFLKARAGLKTPSDVAGAIENGLGIVYTQYIGNYHVLSRDFYWPNIEKPPIPYISSSPGHPSFVAILNQALGHLEEGKRLEEQKDRDFARDRFVNNLDDICIRIMLLRHEPYVALDRNRDPLAGAAASIGDRLESLRRDPLAWVRKTRADLSKRLPGSGVAAVPVTIAQLGALELDLASETQGVTAQQQFQVAVFEESLTPVEAIQVALSMGFRDRGFFEHPAYMGMCPVILSSAFGSRYGEIVQRFVGIEPKRLLIECPSD